MKLSVYGKTPESKARLRNEIEQAGFAYDDNKPDIIISYGGDGTFLRAEQHHPGVPKALFRHSTICNKCHNYPIQHALTFLKKKNYAITRVNKLRARAGKDTLLATNDIVVRNINPLHAIRFTLSINGKQENGEYIGDGIVISTPWGSTGYYNSITRKTFTKGIGVAFNNTTTKEKPLLLPATARIKLTITRGEAHVAADNNPHIHILKEGQSVATQQSAKQARIIQLNGRKRAR